MRSVPRKRVVFGIDEGMPARVAASILRNQGFEVIAIHLSFDLEALGEDPALYPSAMRKRDPSRIEKFCDSLGIPLKCIDVTEESLAKVYDPFWMSTLTGRHFMGSVAWARGVLFPKLEGITTTWGGGYLATGHLAGLPELHRYAEPTLDQSSMISRLNAATLKNLILPAGEVSLERALRLAHEIGGLDSARPEFNLALERAAFIQARAARGRWEWAPGQLEDPRLRRRAGGAFFLPGPVRGSTEVTVSEHEGLPGFQIGMRHPDQPDFYVRGVEVQSRTLVLAAKEDLAANRIFVEEVRWIGDRPNSSYRPARVSVERDYANVRYAELGPIALPGKVFEFPGGFAEVRLEGFFYGIAPGEILLFQEDARIVGSAVVVEGSRGAVVENPIENPDAPT